jgi:hypothetical protein
MSIYLNLRLWLTVFRKDSSNVYWCKYSFLLSPEHLRSTRMLKFELAQNTPLAILPQSGYPSHPEDSK